MVQALLATCPGEIHLSRVMGPTGQELSAPWAMVDGGSTAIIEMAAAAGLTLLRPDQRNPGTTTTFGVGQMIISAINAGAQRIIVGVGGSATVDGGTGAAQALGLHFNHPKSAMPMTANDLGALTSISWTRRDARLDDTEILVACDVTNPLLGPEGAAAVYGPQKGATEEQVRHLEEGLAHLSALVGGKLHQVAGAGASGGLAFGLAAFGGARLVSGIDLVFKLVDFDHRIEQCDLVITGEGKLDHQSFCGKVVGAVAEKARLFRVPAVAIVGSNEMAISVLRQRSFYAYSLQQPGTTIEEAHRQAAQLVTARASVVARHFADRRFHS
ncbi:MAG: glycerate kinase [Proteobacteria bacterium]|nr:glycerate kinase [Pseudomonadota bacterium]